MLCTLPNDGNFEMRSRSEADRGAGKWSVFNVRPRLILKMMIILLLVLLLGNNISLESSLLSPSLR